MVRTSLKAHMKHYKDSDNNVYAYELDGSQDAFILPGLTPITEAEADALRAPPPPGVPQTVTRFQALAALHLAGRLTAVQAIMAAPETPVIAKLAWDNALSFERNSPTLLMLAAAIGMTSQDLDALFTQAATIEA